MAYSYGLTRTAAKEFPDGSWQGASGYGRVNGTQYMRFKFDMSALRTALGDRKIKITSITFGWSTSAKFTYNCYFSTGDSDGTKAGSAKGTSSTSYVGISFNSTVSAVLTALENQINNTSNNNCYFTLRKSGSASGNGYCRYGTITVYYELAEPKDKTIIHEISANKEYALMGESVDYSATIHNSQMTAVTSAQVELYAESGSTEIAVAAPKTYAVSIASDGTASIGGTANIYSGLALARGTQIKMRVTITASTTASETADFIKLLDKYYNPKIEAFSLARCSDVSGEMKRDDSGTKIMCDINVALDNSTAGNFWLRAYYEENGEVDIASSSYIDLDLATNFDTLIAGVTDNTTFFEDYTFSNASAWFFKLVLSDGSETAMLDFDVAKSFANVHLAGYDSGGVSIGMFSTATQGHPRFEVASNFPAYFYGDVHVQGQLYGGTNYSTNEIQMPYKWIDGKPVYRRTFYAASVGGSATYALFSDTNGIIDKLISIVGAATTTISGVLSRRVGLPFYAGSYSITAQYDYTTSPKALNIKNTDSVAIKDIIVTIEYTKTTD